VQTDTLVRASRQAEDKMRTVGLLVEWFYEVLSKLFLEEIEIWEIWEMLHGDLHADGSSVLEATPCAFTGAEVHGCLGTKIMFISCYARLRPRLGSMHGSMSNVCCVELLVNALEQREGTRSVPELGLRSRAC
jgi:hypothetical protein